MLLPHIGPKDINTFWRFISPTHEARDQRKALTHGTPAKLQPARNTAPPRRCCPAGSEGWPGGGRRVPLSARRTHIVLSGRRPARAAAGDSEADARPRIGLAPAPEVGGLRGLHQPHLPRQRGRLSARRLPLQQPVVVAVPAVLGVVGRR